MNNLKELNSNELQEIEGGGWLADAVAGIIAYYKCDCKPNTMDVPENVILGMS